MCHKPPGFDSTRFADHIAPSVPVCGKACEAKYLLYSKDLKPVVGGKVAQQLADVRTKVGERSCLLVGRNMCVRAQTVPDLCAQAGQPTTGKKQGLIDKGPITVDTSSGRWLVTTFIGCGASGEVFRCEKQQPSHILAKSALKRPPEAVAIKLIPKLAMATEEVRVRAEVEFSLSLRRWVERADTDSQFGILTECFNGRELLDELIQNGQRPVECARPWMRQLLEQLGLLHAKGMWHLDIKPENVMTHSPQHNEEAELLKLIDGGTAELAGELTEQERLAGGRRFSKHVGGTAAFQPPEAVRGCLYSAATDVWACGILLILMITGRQVYDTPPPDMERQPGTYYHDRDRLFRMILCETKGGLDEVYWRQYLERNIDADTCRFLHRMLWPDPRERPSTQELLRDHWLQPPPPPPPSSIWETTTSQRRTSGRAVSC